MVLAVNWPPQDPAPGQAFSFDEAQLVVVDAAGGVSADGFVHVLDGDVGLVVAAGHNRAAVEQYRGDVQAAYSHNGPWGGLVAAGEGDEAVEHVAAHHQFHGVGDDFA